MELPFSEGAGYSLDELKKMVACQANHDQVSQRDLVDELLYIRLQDARRRKLDSLKAADMLGYSPDYYRDLAKTAPRPPQIPVDELLRILVKGLHQGDTITEREAYRMLADMSSANHPEKPQPGISARKLLTEAITRGLLEQEVSHRGIIQYRRTPAAFVWRKPATTEERGDKAARSARVWRPMQESCTESRSVSLGKLGLDYLLDNVVNDSDPDPDNPAAPCGLRDLCNTVNKLLILSNERMQKQGLPVPTIPTLGTLLTLSGIPSVDDDSHLQKMNWAFSHYTRGITEISPARYMLDATGLRAFTRQWKAIVKGFHEELSKAELVSRAETGKHTIVVCLGYAKL